MAVATLSRGNTSVEVSLLDEAGSPLVATSFGKPEVQIRDSGGTINPRVVDQWSSLESFNLTGRLFDYQKSHDLADLVKSASTTPLELSIPNDAYPDTMTIAAAAGQDSALTLDYPAGRRNIVNVSMDLTRVGDVVGVGNQQASTPTASGSGPVQININGTTIDVPTADLSLSRTVGRPNDAIRRVPGRADPRYEVKAKVTSDVFTFEFETLENIPATLNALTDNIFRERLGRSGVVIDFNGLLGLGEIEGIPVGSSPFRQVHQAGRDWTTVPTLEFRRTYSEG